MATQPNSPVSTDIPAKASSEISYRPAYTATSPRLNRPHSRAYNHSVFVEDLPEYRPYAASAGPATPHRRTPRSPIATLHGHLRNKHNAKLGSIAHRLKTRKFWKWYRRPDPLLSVRVSPAKAADGTSTRTAVKPRLVAPTMADQTIQLAADEDPLVATVAFNVPPPLKRVRTKLRKRPTALLVAALCEKFPERAANIRQLRSTSFLEWRRQMLKTVAEQKISRRVSIKSKSSASTDRVGLLRRRSSQTAKGKSHNEKAVFNKADRRTRWWKVIIC